MGKINNEQRGGLVKILVEIKKQIENRGIWNTPERGEIQAVAEAKHKVAELKTASSEAYDRVREAERRVSAEVSLFDDQFRAVKQKDIENVTLAIRDVWASDDIEDAKAIVAKFVQQ